jgi:hypothetical protein
MECSNTWCFIGRTMRRGAGILMPNTALFSILATDNLAIHTRAPLFRIKQDEAVLPT